MRNVICNAVALLGVALTAHAQQIVPLAVYITHANKNLTNSVSQSFVGAVDSVSVEIPASQTADVQVVSAPAYGSGLPGVVLYSNAAATASATIRPRYVPTDNTGSTNALVGAVHQSEPYLGSGDTVTLRVVQASAGTNHNIRAFVKLGK